MSHFQFYLQSSLKNLAKLLVYNLSRVFYPVALVVAVFPDLSGYFGEYNFVITDRNGRQNSQNNTQVVNK